MADDARPLTLNTELVRTYHVPFEGDAECFKVRPNQSYMTTFGAEIVGRELLLRFQDANLTAAQVKSQDEQQIKLYRDMLDYLRKDLNGLNGQIGGHARGVVEQRKQKLLSDRSLTADLGVPLGSAPSTDPARHHFSSVRCGFLN